MTLLQWKPEYSVGIASMDDEHRTMIELINETYAAFESKQDVTDIEACLGDIFNTISMHFALEERLMRDNAYSEYRAHKEDHELLLDQLRDLMDDYDRNQEKGRDALQNHLSDWFTGHFSTFDARLHDQLES